MKVKYAGVLHAFRKHPWAITPEKFAEIEGFLQGKVAAPRKLVVRGQKAPEARGGGGVQMAGRIALLPLFGVISQRANLMSEISGGTSAEMYGRQLEALVADRQVKAIVMVIDSPGGSVLGVPELAAKINALKADKKIVAIADAIAASAAYWLGCQASELNVTPSGQVGSIGVIAQHVDESAANEKAGIKTTLVTAGRYKGEGDPSQPLGDEALAQMQKMVDDYYGMFVRDVARGRGKTENRVKSDFGQGRVVLAEEAVSRGMADRVATLDQVLSRLGAGAGTSAAAAQARARRIEVEGIGI